MIVGKYKLTEIWQDCDHRRFIECLSKRFYNCKSPIVDSNKKYPSTEEVFGAEYYFA